MSSPRWQILKNRQERRGSNSALPPGSRATEPDGTPIGLCPVWRWVSSRARRPRTSPHQLVAVAFRDSRSAGGSDECPQTCNAGMHRWPSEANEFLFDHDQVEGGLRRQHCLKVDPVVAAIERHLDNGEIIGTEDPDLAILIADLDGSRKCSIEQSFVVRVEPEEQGNEVSTSGAANSSGGEQSRGISLNGEPSRCEGVEHNTCLIKPRGYVDVDVVGASGVGVVGEGICASEGVGDSERVINVNETVDDHVEPFVNVTPVSTRAITAIRSSMGVSTVSPEYGGLGSSGSRSGHSSHGVQPPFASGTSTVEGAPSMVIRYPQPLINVLTMSNDGICRSFSEAERLAGAIPTISASCCWVRFCDLRSERRNVPYMDRLEHIEFRARRLSQILVDKGSIVAPSA